MSNPFALNVSDLYSKAAAIQNPYIGGSQVGGGINGGQVGGAQGTGYTPKTSPAQADINAVAKIGADKKPGFEVGLGGTNNPDDHKLFFAA